MTISKIHVLYDEAQGTWHNVFEAPGLNGIPVRAVVPREMQEPRRVARALLNAGATISLDDIALSLVAAAIEADAPIVHQRAQVGWLPRGAAFVSLNHVANHPLNQVTYAAPEKAASAIGAEAQSRGTLEGWQQLIAIAQHSTAMIVCLCATFAAPLLWLLKRPSFGLVLVGPTRWGKTTAQVVGASAQGHGQAEDLPNLNATSAGLLALAKATNDHALFIDEIGTARGPKRDIYVTLRDSTYALMSGRDVIRHPSWTGLGSGSPSTFRVIVVLSSEHSPDIWAARNGETRDPGETARLIGLPLAALGATIFDRPPADVSAANRAGWERTQLARLHNGMPRQRGVAFARYLDAIVRRPKETAARARRLITRFETDVAPASTSPVARDIVAKFGVQFAAGVTAADAGVLPISKRVMASAIHRACLAALNALPDPQAELRRDVERLKEGLSGASIRDATHLDGPTLRLLPQADGFFRSRGDGREYVVRAQVFSSWFATPAQVRAVLDHLAEEGYLQLSRPASQGRSNAWAQGQPLWPNGIRPRSITIFLPRGLDDLTSGAG